MRDALDIIRIAALYAEAAGGLPETTVSSRVFNDSKKLRMMRAGAGITLGRYNMAMRWFAAFWPEGRARPAELTRYLSASGEDAA